MKLYQSEVVLARPAFLGGNQWRLSGLKPLTVIFGRNGSGKSLLLRRWRDDNPAGAHYIVPERGGDIGFSPQHIQLQMDHSSRRDQSSSNISNNYRDQIVARIQGYLIARGSTRDSELPGRIEDLEQFLSNLMPEFEVRLTGQGNPPYAIVREGKLASADRVSGVHQLSSGEAEMLTVALDVLTMAAIWDMKSADNRVLLIDEPDAHIHPDLQLRFADFIVQVATKYKLQVVVATHSTAMLAAFGQFGGDYVGVVYFNKAREEQRARLFGDVEREMAACLGGHALMAPLFGAQLLLVEGDDDYRIWSQVPRHGIASFAVVPCGGDRIFGYQRSLETILGSLRQERAPAGCALLDGDKPLPVAGPQSPQNQIPFVRLGCRESENLYLTNEVLALMSTNWSAAAVKIAAEAHRFGAKQPRLLRANQWNRTTDDLKDVISAVADIIDPKRVHWTVRVGAALGRARPSGELLQFVGTEVVNRLWGVA